MKEGGQVLLRKDHHKTPKCFAVSVLRGLPRGMHDLSQASLSTGERKQSEFPGSVNSGFKLVLIPGDPKNHCGPPVKVGSYGGMLLMELGQMF